MVSLSVFVSPGMSRSTHSVPQALAFFIPSLTSKCGIGKLDYSHSTLALVPDSLGAECTIGSEEKDRIEC